MLWRLRGGLLGGGSLFLVLGRFVGLGRLEMEVVARPLVVLCLTLDPLGLGKACGTDYSSALLPSCLDPLGLGKEGRSEGLRALVGVTGVCRFGRSAEICVEEAIEVIRDEA